MATYYWKGGDTSGGPPGEKDLDILANYRTTIDGETIPDSKPGVGDIVLPANGSIPAGSQGTSYAQWGTVESPSRVGSNYPYAANFYGDIYAAAEGDAVAGATYHGYVAVVSGYVGAGAMFTSTSWLVANEWSQFVFFGSIVLEGRLSIGASNYYAPTSIYVNKPAQIRKGQTIAGTVVGTAEVPAAADTKTGAYTSTATSNSVEGTLDITADNTIDNSQMAGIGIGI